RIASENLDANRPIASSQEVSTRVPFLRILGEVSLPGMRFSSGNIDPLTQITPLLWASSSPRTSTTWPSFIPTSTPHPVPQKRHTDLCQLWTGCRRATISSRSPQPTAPAATAPPSPPSVIKTSRRLISEVSRPSSIRVDAFFSHYERFVE